MKKNTIIKTAAVAIVLLFSMNSCEKIENINSDNTIIPEAKVQVPYTFSYQANDSTTYRFISVIGSNTFYVYRNNIFIDTLTNYDSNEVSVHPLSRSAMRWLYSPYMYSDHQFQITNFSVSNDTIQFCFRMDGTILHVFRMYGGGDFIPNLLLYTKNNGVNILSDTLVDAVQSIEDPAEPQYHAINITRYFTPQTLHLIGVCAAYRILTELEQTDQKITTGAALCNARVLAHEKTCKAESHHWLHSPDHFICHVYCEGAIGKTYHYGL